jgi:hypothetical protein
MSNGNPVTEAQASAMLQRLESETGAREAELLEQARAAAGRLRGEAFVEARKKVAIGVAAERRRVAWELARARANLETRQRQAKQRELSALLARAGPGLRLELAHRWQQPKPRQRWIEGLVDVALAVAQRGDWIIECPVTLTDAERSELTVRIEAAAGIKPAFKENPELEAGLRIQVGLACIDGSLSGLLVNRREIEAMLLHELDAAAHPEESS